MKNPEDYAENIGLHPDYWPSNDREYFPYFPYYQAPVPKYNCFGGKFDKDAEALEEQTLKNQKEYLTKQYVEMCSKQYMSKVIGLPESYEVNPDATFDDKTLRQAAILGGIRIGKQNMTNAYNEYMQTPFNDEEYEALGKEYEALVKENKEREEKRAALRRWCDEQDRQKAEHAKAAAEGFQKHESKPIVPGVYVEQLFAKPMLEAQKVVDHDMLAAIEKAKYPMKIVSSMSMNELLKSVTITGPVNNRCIECGCRSDSTLNLKPNFLNLNIISASSGLAESKICTDCYGKNPKAWNKFVSEGMNPDVHPVRTDMVHDPLDLLTVKFVSYDILPDCKPKHFRLFERNYMSKRIKEALATSCLVHFDDEDIPDAKIAAAEEVGYRATMVGIMERSIRGLMNNFQSQGDIAEIRMFASKCIRASKNNGGEFKVSVNPQPNKNGDEFNLHKQIAIGTKIPLAFTSVGPKEK